MAKLFTGKEVANAITENLIERCNNLKAKGKQPALAVLRVGENPSDLAYERGAINRSEKVGVGIRKVLLEEKVTTAEVIKQIKILNEDDNIDGILVFRPLPSHIDDDLVRNALAREKDVDGIGDESMAGVYGGKEIGYPPCTAQACIEMLKYYGVEIEGSKVTIIGRSLVIGRPVAMMLMKENATVTVCHTKTKDIEKSTKGADIIIASAGKIKAVTKNMVDFGQIIIDVGINVDNDGNIKGDVDFENVESIVEGITPVPRGVGGVTTSILMKHTIEAASKKVKEEKI